MKYQFKHLLKMAKLDGEILGMQCAWYVKKRIVWKYMLLLLIATMLLAASCGKSVVVDKHMADSIDVIASCPEWRMYKLRVDSSEYLIVDGEYGVSIVKHK